MRLDLFGRDGQVVGRGNVDLDQVLADLAAILRASIALIDRLPRLHGQQLTAALATGRGEYERRLGEHLAAE